MRVLVTGGAGFIGSNLCRALALAPEVTEVLVLDNMSTGVRSNLAGLSATVIEASILDPDMAREALVGVNSVVHLAARPSVPRSLEDPRASHDANATGTLNVLEAARQVGAHVVVASSSSVYGSNPQLPKVETMATRPLSPYAASKLATESYALAWGSSFSMKTLALRFFNVYGPMQSAAHAYAAVVPSFLDRIMRGEPLRIYGDGEQTRDFTFVQTVCSVIVEAVTTERFHETPVNLALGTRTSVNHLIEIMKDVTGIDADVEHLEPRKGEVPHSSADPTLLKSLFPDVQGVSLHDGVAATYQWMTGNN
jgi:UDP-glucose 4-epimerase